MKAGATRAVFLSYRREETRHIAGRFADRLTDRLGPQQVFMDVDTIEPGVDFAAVITRAVAWCDVLIALIGPTWSTITDSRGRRRLDDPDDFVVLEIRTALECEIRVIPVLVDGAAMPDRNDLPEGLQSLTRRNAVRLDHETFRSDVTVLLNTVDQILATPAQKATKPLVGIDTSVTDLANTSNKENDDVIATALAKDPDQRYPNAGALATARHSLNPTRPTNPDPAAPDPNIAQSTPRTPAPSTLQQAAAHEQPSRIDPHAAPPAVTYPVGPTAKAPQPEPGFSPIPDQWVQSSWTGPTPALVDSRFNDTRTAAIPPPAITPTTVADPITPYTPPRRLSKAGLILLTVLTLAAVGVTAVMASNRAGGGSSALSSGASNTATPLSAESAATSTPKIGQPISLPTLRQGFAPFVSAVAVGQLDGRPVIVAGGGTYGDQADKVQVFDLATHQPIGQSIGGPDSPINSLAIAQLDGKPVIVAGSQNTTIWVWDLATHQQIGQSFTGEIGIIRSVAAAQLDNKPVLITGSGCPGCGGNNNNPDTIRVWDLATHQQIGQPIAGGDPGIDAIAIGQLDGRPVIISGSLDKAIRVWDLATHQPIGRPLTGHTGGLSALTVTQLDGRPVIISGSAIRSSDSPTFDDDTIRVWDLASQQPIGQPITGLTGGVSALTSAQLDGRPVIISGSFDNTIRLWDLSTHRPIGQPVSTGDGGGITALTVAQMDGKPVIVSGSFQNAIHVWDLMAVAGRK